MASFGRGGGGRGGGGGRHHHSSRSTNFNHSNNPSNSNASSSSNQPKLQVCRNYIATGSCPHGPRCNFSHTVRHYATLDVSDKLPPEMIPRLSYHQSRGGGGGAGSNKVKDRYKATSVAIWETLGGIKLFVGSQDGKWRLYNTAPTTTTNTTAMNHNNNASSNGNTISGVSLTQEFEHYVGGPIDTIHLISSHYFCVGFEISSPLEAPLDTNKAGMVHIWNLSSPGDAPLELMMNTRFAKYASSGRVRCLCTGSAGVGGEGRVWSGGNDGVIREWAMTNTATPTLVRTMSGHLGAVTKLTLSKNGVLWSGGSDGTIRLWNIENGEMAHLIPAVKKDTVAGGDAASTAAAMLGHSGSITGLLPFEVPSSDPSSAGGASPPSSFIFTSSLDETVKVWDATNGSCVASEKHGQGVTSIAFTSDSSGVHPLLLCGLYYGDIMIRGTISNPPLCLLLKISHNFVGVGHELGPVHDIQAGPGCTFYAVGEDGKLTVWQIVGDFGL